MVLLGHLCKLDIYSNSFKSPPPTMNYYYSSSCMNFSGDKLPHSMTNLVSLNCLQMDFHSLSASHQTFALFGTHRRNRHYIFDQNGLIGVSSISMNQDITKIPGNRGFCRAVEANRGNKKKKRRKRFRLFLIAIGVAIIILYYTQGFVFSFKCIG